MTRAFNHETLKEVPTLPGVYLFNDVKGRLLYVGKAVSLRNRLRSYLQKNLPSDRIRKMVRLIHRFEYIVTKTEVEALILENSFIKNNKPVYNILLRDGKTYPYIKLTAEPFPRAIITRRKSAGGSLFGPFPSTRAARQTIRQLHQFFKIRNCDYDLALRSYQPCLQYHLKRCDAPCANLVTSEEYHQGVERARMFLSGKTDELIDILNREMEKASQRLAFERAAHFRDLLGLVNKVRIHQSVAKLPNRKLDVIGYTQSGNQISLMILTIRNSMVSRSKHFLLDQQVEVVEDLVSHLTHYYLHHPDPPGEIAIQNAESFNLFKEAMQSYCKRSLILTSPQKGYKARLLQMAEENARLHLTDREPESVQRLADVLSEHMDLPSLPHTIEGFDISNTQGEHSVASMVSFVNGKPAKRNYRKYKIKTVEGPDDFASMREVVSRRYSRLLNEGKDLPDLILIDGGKGQLNSAHQALTALGLANQPLISLAKKEELICLVNNPDPIDLEERDPALKLLQQVRDEAHRFGLTFHRSRRKKAMLRSELDAIPGLGSKRQKKLLHTFGSVKNIKEASLQQLVHVLGNKTGTNTWHALRNKK